MKILIHVENVRSHAGNQTTRAWMGNMSTRFLRRFFTIFLLRKDSKDCLYHLKLQVSLGGTMSTEERMICLGIPPIPLCGQILMKNIKNLPMIVVRSA
jgi:hypothetical protein